MTLLSFSSALLAASLATATPTQSVEAPATPGEADLLVASAADIATTWDGLLSTYATSDGGFRYEALRGNEADRATLTSLVEQVGAASLDGMSRDERLSFLMNAYNILTVDDVLELWPVESVLQEDGFFDGRTHLVAGTSMTLNQLENDHIRTMGEPRIHFLVNCASTSCPPLAGDAITPANLESLAAAQSQSYVRATSTIDRDAGTVTISQIFEWFAGDFGGADGVRAFVADRLEGDDAAFVRDAGTTIAYVPYDWSLNGR